MGQVIKSFGSVIPTDETFKSVKGAVTTGPIGALGSLANMVIGMPIKTLFGVSGYDTQTGEPIKPEDQVQDMKNAVALAATYGIAKGFHLPSTTAAELNSQGDAALALGDIDKSVMFKQMASQVAPKAGGIIKRIATGAGEGAVTGTVFGGISQAGTPDELAGAIAAGISFAGFGAGLNLLFGKKGSTVPQEVIDQMEQLRQLQSSLNDPLIDASMKTEAISTADNPQQAIINIAKKKPEFLKRSGVARNITDQDQINSALGAGAIYRTNTNGSADLLFPVQDMGPSEIAGWKKSGLLNGDRVSFAGGRLGEVIAQDKESISIVSNDGLLTTFPHELLKYEGSAEPSTFYTGSAFYHPNIFSSIFKDPKIGVLTTDLEALVHVPNAEKIRYNFKNPLVVASNSVFQSILDPDGELFKTAKANGHDGIFVIGPDRTMIISTDVNANIQHLMSVETHTAFGDALKIYREEVEPRIKMKCQEIRQPCSSLTESIVRVPEPE